MLLNFNEDMILNFDFDAYHVLDLPQIVVI